MKMQKKEMHPVMAVIVEIKVTGNVKRIVKVRTPKSCRVESSGPRARIAFQKTLNHLQKEEHEVSLQADVSYFSESSL